MNKKKKKNNVTKQKQKDKEWSDRISRHNAGVLKFLCKSSQLI